VIAHTFTVAPLPIRVWGIGCATLEQKAHSLAKSTAGHRLGLWGAPRMDRRLRSRPTISRVRQSITETQLRLAHARPGPDVGQGLPRLRQLVLKW
jgi:hypothetical protein